MYSPIPRPSPGRRASRWDMGQGSRGSRLAGMQYRVVQTLGNGAGSTILLIADAQTGSKYALKIVRRQSAADDIYVAQAIHEFEVAGRLNHPNILKIYDCRVRRTWLPFRIAGVELLMEYVDGRNLDELKRPALGQLVLIFIHVASALKHMHRRGIYHGDLKPSNLMLSTQGVVKVIDLGTAWIKGQPKDRVQGTPQYMAPEQGRERIVDEKTDLYNFGATMYRLLTGEYANSDLPVEYQAVGRRWGRIPSPMELIPEVPGTLNETIMACLDPNPDRRPAGAFEVKHQLVAVARSEVAEPPGQRVEQAGAEPVRLQEQQRLAVTAPIQGGDVQPVVIDRERAGIAAHAGSAASRAPSLSSCAVAPPRVSSRCFAHRKYRCSG